jgi:CDP-diacylglycerol--glycerol-3-phosphate 3-phosphatidyltransferase
MKKQSNSLSLKTFNIADYLSLYRFVAAPALILSIVFERRILTAILLLLSFTTDALDGYIARKKNIETSKGAKLDSIGDLITVLAGLAAFVVFESRYVTEHIAIIITAIGLFVFQITLSLIRFRKMSSFHTYLAKATAVILTVFLVITPIVGPIDILFYLAFGAAIAEASEEIVITFILKKPEENVKGLYWLLKK